MTDAELKELLAGCCMGRDSSWREFIRRFHPLIRGTVGKFSFEGVDDVVQRVYELLIQSNYRILARFDGSFPAFLIYLQRTARHVAIAEYRARERINGRAANLEAALTFLSEPSPAADQLLEAREFMEQFEQAIDGLRPSYREVVSHLYNGLNHREISEILRIPIGTVLTRAARAREILRRSLKVETK